MFAEMVTHGPGALAAVPEAVRAVVVGRIEAGFTVAFLVVAAFAATSAVRAWTSPMRRL